MKQVQLAGIWRHLAGVDFAVEVTEKDLRDREAVINFGVGAGALVRFQVPNSDIIFLQPAGEDTDSQQHFKINKLPGSFSDIEWRK